MWLNAVFYLIEADKKENVMLIALALQLLAIFLLALATDKHYKVLFKGRPNTFTVYSLRTIGWCLLLCSMLSVSENSLAVGAVYWIVGASLNIAITSLSLYRLSRKH